MDNLGTKGKIIHSLLESPKTTGEIALALDYDKYQYNAVGTKLKELVLEHILRSEPKNIKGVRGPPPTYYEISYEIPILRKMWVEYPPLRSTMQKNETILSMLIENYFSRDPVINPLLKLFANEKTLLVSLLKKMLQLSPTFFEMCLMNDEASVITKAYNVWAKTTWQGMETSKIFGMIQKKTDSYKVSIEMLQKEKSTNSDSEVQFNLQKNIDIRQDIIKFEERDLDTLILKIPLMLYIESFLGSIRIDYFTQKINEDILDKVLIQ